MLLSGRSAVITGASHGLGRSIARLLVKEGAHVYLIAREERGLEEVYRELLPHRRDVAQKVEYFAGDVGDPMTSMTAAKRVEKFPAPVSILVNNAGINGPIGLTEEASWLAWMETMRVNCFGTVLFCRAFVRTMKQHGYGKIINLSGGGATGPRPNFSAYAASKAAVVRFTETLAEECKDDGIDVNAIAPGAMNTRMLDEMVEAGAEKIGAEAYGKLLAQREKGGADPELAAELVVFLASRASDGISGRLLSAVWDDWRALPGAREALAKSDVFTLRRIVPEDRRMTWSAA